MSNAELSEVFFLVCGPDQNVAYQSWILSKFPSFKSYFSLNVTPRETTSRPEDSTVQVPDHVSSVHLD